MENNAASGAQASLESEARRVFRETSRLVHDTLVDLYGIPEADASDIERDIEDWFARFCRRNPLVPPRDGIPQLLALTCSYARGHQQKQVRENLLSPDRDLRELLARSSEEVAAALRVSQSAPASPPRGRAGWRHLWRKVSRRR